MKISKYATTQLSDYAHQFFSDGPNGKFELRIRFYVVDQQMYNLSFGVWDPQIEQMDDLIETRNGDMDKILATVACAVEEFLAKNEKATIIVSGSSRARTRKYQMSIARHLTEISGKHVVFGLEAEKNEEGNIIGGYPAWEGKWSKFRNGLNYDAFMIYPK